MSGAAALAEPQVLHLGSKALCTEDLLFTLLMAAEVLEHGLEWLLGQGVPRAELVYTHHYTGLAGGGI